MVSQQPLPSSEETPTPRSNTSTLSVLSVRYWSGQPIGFHGLKSCVVLTRMPVVTFLSECLFRTPLLATTRVLWARALGGIHFPDVHQRCLLHTDARPLAPSGGLLLFVPGCCSLRERGRLFVEGYSLRLTCSAGLVPFAWPPGACVPFMWQDGSC